MLPCIADRQLLDFGGLYDRKELFWKTLQEVVVCAACAPPGGGRHQLNGRFLRHFCMLLIPQPNEATLVHIFRVCGRALRVLQAVDVLNIYLRFDVHVVRFAGI